MLEIGSGGSTAWFAKRVAHITSLENDEAWFDRVSREVAPFANVDPRLLQGDWICGLEADDLPTWRVGAPANYLAFLDGLRPASFDVVLNDGWGRDAVGIRVLRLVRPGGLLVWDDDPPAHPRLLDEVSRWRRVPWFDGIHRTTFFFKPGVDSGSPDDTRTASTQ